MIEVKIVKLRNRWVMILIVAFAVIMLINQYPIGEGKEDRLSTELEEVSSQRNVDKQYPGSDLAVLEVVLQEQYIDGRMASEMILETISAMEDFWSKYEDYQLIDQKVGQVTFRKQVNDISPYLKKVGYFGLYEDVLTIFEGAPTHQQVIQSFYHINLNQLSKEDRERLNKGIKIDSKSTYQQTLEVFRDTSPTEQVQG